MPTTLRAKCVIVGDSAVGKSAISQVFHSDGATFPKNYSMTFGVDVLSKIIHVPETHGESVEIYLYDSSGKETFAEVAQKYWDHPNMVMVVYDCTNETSFNSCAKWLQRVRSQKPDIPFPGVLVANKTDLDQRRTISPKQGQDFAQENGLEYFECSAKEMQHVDQIFQHLAQAYYKLYQEKVDLFKTLA